MKRILLVIITIAGVCCITWIAYRAGCRRGFDHALTLQNGVFVGSLDALEKLQAGDMAGAISRIETLCFSAADTVYSGRIESRFVADTFFDALRDYRNDHRTNNAAWSVTESNLESKLKSWK